MVWPYHCSPRPLQSPPPWSPCSPHPQSVLPTAPRGTYEHVSQIMYPLSAQNSLGLLPHSVETKFHMPALPLLPLSFPSFIPTLFPPLLTQTYQAHPHQRAFAWAVLYLECLFPGSLPPMTLPSPPSGVPDCPVLHCTPFPVSPVPLPFSVLKTLISCPNTRFADF